MKVTAILTADIELRAFPPICRTDDHWAAQEKKIAWLRNLQEEHSCPIFDAGDLFDKHYKSHPSHMLLSWAIAKMPENICTIPGNHDLPGKSILNYPNSAMAVLEGAGILTNTKIISLQDVLLLGFPWDAPLSLSERQKSQIDRAKGKGKRAVALIHAMVFKKELPFPGCVGYSAQDVCDLLPEMDLIVTGHHHATFTHRSGDILLINPGSFMRNDADQEDHLPSVFLYYAESGEAIQQYIPIEQGVISREHIEVSKAREDRMDAFVEKLGDQVVSGVNFHSNLELVMGTAAVSQSVKDKVWQYYEAGI